MMERFEGKKQVISKMHGEPWDDGFEDENELRAACKKLKIEYMKAYKNRYGQRPDESGVVINSVIKNMVKNYTIACVPNIEAMVAAFFADENHFVMGRSIVLLKVVGDQYLNEINVIKSGKVVQITPRVKAIRDVLGIKEIRDYRAGVDVNGRLID